MIDYGFTGTTDTNKFIANNFKPAVYVKEYLDRIFSQVSGFTYEIKGSDEFIEMFNHLIIPDTYDITTKVVNDGLGWQNYYNQPTGVTTTYSASGSTKYLVRVDDLFNYVGYGNLLELVTPYNNVLISKKTFTTSVKINSTFSGTVDNIGYAGGYVYLRLVERIPKNNNSATDSWQVLFEKRHSVFIDYPTFDVELNIPSIHFVQGNQYAIQIEFDPINDLLAALTNPKISGTTNTMYIPAEVNQPITYELSPKLISGDKITPKAPANIKQIDFLKSLINQFNFVVYSDLTNYKHIIFEKYDDYYVYTLPQYIKSNSLDWTNKIDYTNGLKIKSNIDLPKSYLFTYKKDSDYYSELYSKRYNKQYGELMFEDQFGLVEQKKVELIFSPTVLISDFGTNRKYPALYKLENNTKKLTGTNIRLGFYNGLVDCSNFNIGIMSGTTYQTWDSRTTYPQFSNYYMVSGSPVFDIHFNSPNEYYFVQDSDYKNVPNSYNEYYINEVTELTNPNVVYVECSAYLNSVDISSLDLKIPIYINMGSMNGAYFKLLKVEYTDSNTPSRILLQKISI